MNNNTLSKTTQKLKRSTIFILLLIFGFSSISFAQNTIPVTKEKVESSSNKSIGLLIEYNDPNTPTIQGFSKNKIGNNLYLRNGITLGFNTADNSGLRFLSAQNFTGEVLWKIGLERRYHLNDRFFFNYGIESGTRFKFTSIDNSVTHNSSLGLGIFGGINYNINDTFTIGVEVAPTLYFGDSQSSFGENIQVPMRFISTYNF